MKRNLLTFSTLTIVAFISTGALAKHRAANGNSGASVNSAPKLKYAATGLTAVKRTKPAFSGWMLEADHADLKALKDKKTGVTHYFLTASGVNPLVVRRDVKGQVHPDSLARVLSSFSYSTAPKMLDIVAGEFKQKGKTLGAKTTHFIILNAQPQGAKGAMFEVQQPRGVLLLQSGQYRPVFMFMPQGDLRAKSAMRKGGKGYFRRKSDRLAASVKQDEAMYPADELLEAQKQGNAR